MNRVDKISLALQDIGMRNGWYIGGPGWDELAKDLLAIADDRELVTTSGFAQMIGRHMTTICSWRDRGKFDVPEPAFVTNNGPLWDVQDVERWLIDHQDQVRAVGAVVGGRWAPEGSPAYQGYVMNKEN